MTDQQREEINRKQREYRAQRKVAMQNINKSFGKTESGLGSYREKHKEYSLQRCPKLVIKGVYTEAILFFLHSKTYLHRCLTWYLCYLSLI
jgi:hypothetical protein